MNDVKLLENIMTELNAQHAKLSLLLRESSKVGSAIGFKIEQITKARESTDEFKENGIDKLDVTFAERDEILDFHHKYYRGDDLSTEFVERLPGIIVCNSHQDDIRDTVYRINRLKDIVLKVIKMKKRDKYQRHEFIHSLYPRIMTDHIRRHIKVFDARLTHCWFNWTSRPTPRPIKTKEAENFLLGKIDKPLGLMTQPEWTALIKANIAEVKSGTYESIQQLKHVQLLPIMTFKQLINSKETKRGTANANVPFILLGQTPELNNGILYDLPKVNGLPAFNKAEQESKERKRRGSKTRKCINEYFNLHGVFKS